MLSEMVKNLVWQDFKVGAEGSWVVFRRVEEKHFPRKSTGESTQLNDEINNNKLSIRFYYGHYGRPLEVLQTQEL